MTSSFFSLAGKLSSAGVLGINRRNADYVLKYNRRSCYPLVDDKLRTKAIALAAGISVPQLYGVVKFQFQLKELSNLLAKYNSFVIKPAHGSGGEGIVIVSESTKKGFRLANGTIVDLVDLRYHISTILGGTYSLGGRQDCALIEYKVEFDEIFDDLSYQGVPDIRIIVFLGVPVMAMVRLPTRMSDGKANLHQGAIGAGITIAEGKTVKAVWKNQIIDEHPDTGIEVEGVTIPHWDDLLNLAARSSQLTGLGLQGIDIVLDRTLGPLILEMNARPGLNIQIANRTGILPRFKLVETHITSLSTVEEKVAFAKENFS